MSPLYDCPSCGERCYSSSTQSGPCPTCGALLTAEHRFIPGENGALPVDGIEPTLAAEDRGAGSYRFMLDDDKPGTTIETIGRALNDLDDESWAKVQVLVAELLARSRDRQDGNRSPQLRVDVEEASVRVELAAPTNGATSPAAGHGLDASWGGLIADRWGVDDNNGARVAWFEIVRDRD